MKKLEWKDLINILSVVAEAVYNSGNFVIFKDEKENYYCANSKEENTRPYIGNIKELNKYLAEFY